MRQGSCDHLQPLSVGDPTASSHSSPAPPLCPVRPGGRWRVLGRWPPGWWCTTGWRCGSALGRRGRAVPHRWRPPAPSAPAPSAPAMALLPIHLCVTPPSINHLPESGRLRSALSRRLRARIKMLLVCISLGLSLLCTQDFLFFWLDRWWCGACLLLSAASGSVCCSHRFVAYFFKVFINVSIDQNI